MSETNRGRGLAILVVSHPCLRLDEPIELAMVDIHLKAGMGEDILLAGDFRPHKAGSDVSAADGRICTSRSIPALLTDAQT
jgi:hypothetical protein